MREHVADYNETLMYLSVVPGLRIRRDVVRVNPRRRDHVEHCCAGSETSHDKPRHGALAIRHPRVPAYQRTGIPVNRTAKRPFWLVLPRCCCAMHQALVVTQARICVCLRVLCLVSESDSRAHQERVGGTSGTSRTRADKHRTLNLCRRLDDCTSLL